MPIIGKGTYRKLNFEDIIFISLFILGIIVAILAPSIIIYYSVSFLSGAFFGRIWYKTRKALQAKYLIMITLFIIGFVVGGYILNAKYGNSINQAIITIILYLMGIYASYQLHKKGLIKAVDY